MEPDTVKDEAARLELTLGERQFVSLANMWAQTNQLLADQYTALAAKDRQYLQNFLSVIIARHAIHNISKNQKYRISEDGAALVPVTDDVEQ